MPRADSEVARMPAGERAPRTVTERARQHCGDDFTAQGGRLTAHPASTPSQPRNSASASVSAQGRTTRALVSSEESGGSQRQHNERRRRRRAESVAAASERRRRIHKTEGMVLPVLPFRGRLGKSGAADEWPKFFHGPFEPAQSLGWRQSKSKPDLTAPVPVEPAVESRLCFPLDIRASLTHRGRLPALFPRRKASRAATSS